MCKELADCIMYYLKHKRPSEPASGTAAAGHASPPIDRVTSVAGLVGLVTRAVDPQRCVHDKKNCSTWQY